jgi:polyribonucleotide nucleotidyltransferase
VKILEADEKGRLRLSMKALLEAPAPVATDSETPESAD